MCEVFVPRSVTYQDRTLVGLGTGWDYSPSIHPSSLDFSSFSRAIPLFSTYDSSIDSADRFLVLVSRYSTVKMTFKDYVSIFNAFAAILSVAISRFLVRLYRARATIARLKREGLV